MTTEPTLRRASEIIGSQERLAGEAATLSEIIDVDWIAKDTHFQRVQSSFSKSVDGKQDAAFVQLESMDHNNLFVVLVSQQVLVEQLRKLDDGHHFPCIVKFVHREGGSYGTGYYTIE